MYKIGDYVILPNDLESLHKVFIHGEIAKEMLGQRVKITGLRSTGIIEFWFNGYNRWWIYDYMVNQSSAQLQFNFMMDDVVKTSASS